MLMETKCNVFEKLITSIVEGMEDCVNTWCSKKEISNISLLEWKTTVIKQTHNKVVELKHKSSHHNASKKNIVIPIDNVSGIVYYELGLI